MTFITSNVTENPQVSMYTSTLMHTVKYGMCNMGWNEISYE